MCSILLVEDLKVMAETLVHILRAKGNFSVPDVVLPRTSGIELVSMIQQQYPGIPCLMISGRSAGQYVSRSLAAGARGYVLKDDLPEVMKGIRRVLKGGTYLSRQLDRKEE